MNGKRTSQGDENKERWDEYGGEPIHRNFYQITDVLPISEGGLEGKYSFH